MTSHLKIQRTATQKFTYIYNATYILYNSWDNIIGKKTAYRLHSHLSSRKEQGFSTLPSCPDMFWLWPVSYPLDN
jgi:esterase/lipase